MRLRVVLVVLTVLLAWLDNGAIGCAWVSTRSPPPTVA